MISAVLLVSIGALCEVKVPDGGGGPGFVVRGAHKQVITIASGCGGISNDVELMVQRAPTTGDEVKLSNLGVTDPALANESVRLGGPAPDDKLIRTAAGFVDGDDRSDGALVAWGAPPHSGPVNVLIHNTVLLTTLREIPGEWTLRVSQPPNGRVLCKGTWSSECQLSAGTDQVQFSFQDRAPHGVTFHAARLDPAGRRVLEIPLKVADRGEPFTIPLMPTFVIECRGGALYGAQEAICIDSVEHGISNEALRTGACELAFDAEFVQSLLGNKGLPPEPTCSAVDRTDPSGALGYILALYGNQVFDVEVTQGNATRKSQWAVRAGDHLRSSHRFVLAAPDGDNGDGPITVTVKSADTNAPVVIGPAGNLVVASQYTPPSFRARLRPYGLFTPLREAALETDLLHGLVDAHWPKKADVRFFVTLPIAATAIRFPANELDLRNTSQTPVYQVSFVETGLLVGVEPWDYNLGRPHLPVRALGGFNVANARTTVEGAQLTFVGGLAAAVPILDSQTLQNTVGSSALAIGVFHEWNPVSRSGHLLVNIGFNFGSLLGAQ